LKETEKLKGRYLKYNNLEYYDEANSEIIKNLEYSESKIY
jgi:hypothetical protein